MQKSWGHKREGTWRTDGVQCDQRAWVWKKEERGRVRREVRLEESTGGFWTADLIICLRNLAFTMITIWAIKVFWTGIDMVVLTVYKYYTGWSVGNALEDARLDRCHWDVAVVMHMWEDAGLNSYDGLGGVRGGKPRVKDGAVTTARLWRVHSSHYHEGVCRPCFFCQLLTKLQLLEKQTL